MTGEAEAARRRADQRAAQVARAGAVGQVQPAERVAGQRPVPQQAEGAGEAAAAVHGEHRPGAALQPRADRARLLVRARVDRRGAAAAGARGRAADPVPHPQGRKDEGEPQSQVRGSCECTFD